MTLAAGAAALATGLSLPAANAQAATAPARSVPQPHHSLYVAGYQQTGCHHQGYPVYVEISGTIKVPAATDINGTPGISYDIYNFGGKNNGVNGGVAVDNSGGQAFYTAFGQWNDGAPITAFAVQPGDKLQVTIEDEGSSGYLVEISDESTGQEAAATEPDARANRCQVAAYEKSAYPAYDHTTKTSAIAFRFTRVVGGEGPGQGQREQTAGEAARARQAEPVHPRQHQRLYGRRDLQARRPQQQLHHHRQVIPFSVTGTSPAPR
jgi:hypothetical protein